MLQRIPASYVGTYIYKVRDATKGRVTDEADDKKIKIINTFIIISPRR